MPSIYLGHNIQGVKRNRMSKVLILCFTDTKHDTRVARQIDFLKDTYDVTFGGYGTTLQNDVTFFHIPHVPLTPFRKAALAVLLLTRQYEAAYWMQYPYKSLKEKLQPKRFDLIVANDIETLPLAFYLKTPNTKILFDAHEYAPRHFEDRLYWRVFFQGFNTYFCQKLIPQTDGMFTVCEGLAQEYERNFSVRPRILTNAPTYLDLSPSTVDPKRIRLIHHGIFTISRKIENMVAMMQQVEDRYSLDLMLILPKTASQKTKDRYKDLQEMVEATKRVQIIPPVLSQEVVSFIHQYDMGIFILEPINFNYTHALPNKLFNFVQARLGIGISPSVEMKRVVEKHRLGVVADDFSSQALALRLNKLTVEDIRYFKESSHQAARILSADQNRQRMLETVSEILSQPN